MKMKPKLDHSLQPTQRFHVDIPTEDCIGDESGEWRNVGEFDTEAAALASAQEHFGADYRGRVFLVPSQMVEQLDNVESWAADMVAVLQSELAPLRTWQSARSPKGALALPDEVWDGMTISIDKIEAVLCRAGIDKPERK
jgi:hypothetical protein